MCVPMDEDDSPGALLPKAREPLAKLGEPIPRNGDEGIRLHQHHQPGVLPRLGSGLVERGEHCFHARAVLGMVHIVVAPRHVQRYENPAAAFPAPVLAEFPRRVTENFAPATQALKWLLAVAPFVVARNEDEAVADALELALALVEPVVRAGARARADVAQMYDEREWLRVHLVDQPIEALHFIGGVRRIPEHAERQLALRQRRERRRAAGEPETKRRKPGAGEKADGAS